MWHNIVSGAKTIIYKMKFLEVIFFSLLVCQVSARSVEGEHIEISLDDVEKYISDLEENPNKPITLEELLPYVNAAGSKALNMFIPNDEIFAYYLLCQKKLNITNDELFVEKEIDISNPPENLKCYMTCIFEGAGVLKDNELSGGLAVFKKITDILAQKFSDNNDNENVQDFIRLNQCFSELRPGECGKAFNIQICVDKLNKANFK